jgi:hypothetical protein
MVVLVDIESGVEDHVAKVVDGGLVERAAARAATSARFEG